MNNHPQISHPTSKWNILAICMLCLFASLSHLQAQDCTPTQIHTRDDGNFDSSSNINGQSFTACADAEIISLSVTANGVGAPATTPAGTYNLYIAVEPGLGMSIPTVSPVATLTFASAPGPLAVITFNLATPFPISNGTTYRFFIDFPTPNALRVAITDDYGDGNLVTNNLGYSPSVDLDFQINTQATSAPPTPTVPTLSEWGLIVLALLLMTLGTLYLVQPSFRKNFGVKQQEPV